MFAAERNTKMMINQRSVNSANRAQRSRSLWILALVGLGVGFFVPDVFAHGVEEAASTPALDEIIRANTWRLVSIASLFIGLVTVLTLAARPKTARVKWISFLAIVLPTIVVTAYLASSTIFLNMISVTKGPVHWHAEFQVVSCGEELDLVDPRGLSNRVGSPVLHEHGDNWIHVEGVPVQLADVNLHRFFEEIGGELSTEHMLYPTNSGSVYVTNGDTCPDGGTGELQLFLYRTDGSRVTQTKLEDFPEYVLAPYAQVPPGDCFILEFGEAKDKTDRICQQLEIAIQKGELTLD